MINENKPLPSQHPWEQYLPSKRIQKVLLVIIVIIIGYSLWKPAKKLLSNIRQNIQTENKTTTTLPMPVVEQSNTPISIDKDTDGDGLADWQETLIGTDPEIPNSESEIPQELREIIVEKTKEVVTTDDKIALNIYQQLLSNPKGTNITEAIQAATTKEVLDLSNTLDKEALSYGYDDINLVDYTSENTINYRNQIKIIQKELTIPSETFQSLYNSFLAGQKTINETVFQSHITQEVTKLLSIEVPLPLADQHLMLINSLSKINNLLSLSSTVDESIRYAALIAFQKNINQTASSIENIITMVTTP